MFWKLMIEGLGASAILFLACAIGIRNGGVGLVHLYHKDVQGRCVELGLTTHKRIMQRAVSVKSIVIAVDIIYLILCVYGVNGVRGFADGFLHTFVILSIMNLFDRFVIDELWVGHTNAWTISGTEDLKPYITNKDRAVKWIFGTVGFAAMSAALAGIMALILK